MYIANLKPLKSILNRSILAPSIAINNKFYSPLRRTSLFDDRYQKKARDLRIQQNKLKKIAIDNNNSIQVIDNLPTDEQDKLHKDSLVVATLSHGTLTIVRQLEMLNVFMFLYSILQGFEQNNKYVIYDEVGQTVGYLVEESSFWTTIMRQVLRTHRPFKAYILDPQGNVILKTYRPFWFINSRIFISTKEDEVIGEVQKEWHLWRRKYALFIGYKQFAYIDAPFLSWDFELKDKDNDLLAFISRSFSGFAREIFTDTGHYSLVMDSLPQTKRKLSLDERAVALATAITLDFDYFSRHSSTTSK
ncbi:Scramblase-domain-containing protein [Neoconidiobolus thromboides FSU 785]|nr:Scramblase-domain-containing protein [Neoconidiobolus thromboides FSU 785]